MFSLNQRLRANSYFYAESELFSNSSYTRTGLCFHVMIEYYFSKNF